MARIAFLSLVFPPDSVSTAQIMGQLAVDLKELGNEVTVLTTSPHYNRDLEAEAKQPLENYWGPILQKSEFCSIPTYHVLMPKKSKRIIARLLPWLSFHVLSTIAGIFILSKPDVIIVPSPPLTIGVSAWLLRLFHGSRYIYNVQEIYPDYAINLGAIRNKWLIRLLKWLELLVYRKAAAVSVIAPHMKRNLLQKGVPASKVEIIPNFVDTEEFRPQPKVNEFSLRYQIHDRFVVSYAGNMGPAQDLENFIQAAALLENHKDIHFLMMGDGMLREEIEKTVSDLNMDNFTLLPYQPYSLMPQIYGASDLCLVPQSPGITAVAVPSKVYRIMACARPVLAVTIPNSDLAELVDSAECGLLVEAGDPKQLADVIVEASLAPGQMQSLGQAGREHVVKEYSRPVISQRYHSLIESVLC